jgi:hypothetical protein
VINEELRLAEAVDIVAESLRVHARAQARRGHPVPSEDWIIDAARNVVASLIGTFEAVATDAETAIIAEIGSVHSDPHSQT